jgi:nucleoside 2-deoxyribosyltransferase
MPTTPVKGRVFKVPKEASNMRVEEHGMHGDERPSRVLRISMPETKDCFVAISFDKALDQVSGAIAEAVGSHDFKFNRVDLNPGRPKWTENVPEGIRKAAVVVAVINNKEGDSCRINANVAYELGLAHALGKPVIIIVDNCQDTHFSDIKHFNWLESHSNGEFRRKEFIKRLQNRLTTELNRLNEKYSHPLWPAATVDLEGLGPGNKISPSLLHSLEDAFRYGKDIHGNFHALNASHLVELSTSTYEAIHTTEVESCEIKVRKEFHRYERFYDEEINTVLEKEPGLRRKAEAAISRFANRSLAINLDMVRAYVQDVASFDAGLRDAHQAAVVRCSCKDVNQNTKLYSAVKRLQGSCNFIVSRDAFLAISKEQPR